MNILKKVLFSLMVLSYGLVNGAEYLSPSTIAKGKDGKKLFITGETSKKLVIFDVAGCKVDKTISLPENPIDISLSNDGNKIYITTNSPAGKVLVLNTSGKIQKTINVGHTPMAPIESKDGNTLYVCNRFNNTVSFIDLKSGKETANIAVLREPVAAALSKDGKKLYVANLLPFGAADGDYIASYISVIDTQSKKVCEEITLPNGSMALRGLAISKDGNNLCITHILARYQLPTTQLDRGWMNTNALTIVNTKDNKILSTILLDEVDKGAANPWGVSFSDDGKYLSVAHAGTHEISVIDFEKLTARLKSPVEHMPKIKDVNYDQEASNNLSMLVDIRTRVQLKGNGPRRLVIIGNKAYATEYFTDSLAIAEIDKGYDGEVKSIKLGPVVELTDVRIGEKYFNDAAFCFQGWQSCTTCHPDVRNDGLNWDLLNDGLGNPKSTKSMLLSHKTPPVMVTGIRAKAEVAVRAGIKFIQFAIRADEDACKIDEFLKSLTPVPSPYLVNGQLSESAKRGESVFKKANCASCHSGNLFTDLQSYDLEMGKGIDQGKPFDTPTLVEIWRTAPYLYDGRANTMMDVLTVHNKDDKHGKTSNLKKEELNDLERFILSQ